MIDPFASGEMGGNMGQEKVAASAIAGGAGQ
jgi:hypothetical protein